MMFHCIEIASICNIFVIAYFHRFWSNLVFEPDYMATIVSFLQEAVPAYVSITSLTTNEEIIELYSKIARNVLTVLCRTVTNKESEVRIYWHTYS